VHTLVRPSRCDRPLHEPTCHGEQVSRVGHLVGGRPGPHAIGEQRLGHEDRADPGHDALVEQHLCGRTPARGAPPAQQLRGVDRVREDVRPEVADHRLLVPGAEHVEHPQQVADRRGVLRAQDRADVGGACGGAARAGGPHPPRTVHAQVRVHRGAVVETGQQVLAVGDGAEDGPPGQVEAADAGPAQLRADEDMAGQRAIEQGGRPPQHVTLGHGDARRS
jgi:hypothetical protein